MTDVVLRAQFDYDKKFTEFAKNGTVDHFMPNKPMSAIPGFWRKRKVAPVGSAAAGSINTYQIPASGLLGDVFIEIILGATSGGNYAAYVGIQLMQQIRILHGSNELHNYEYSAVANLQHARMKDEVVNRILTAAGGSASGSARTVYAPIYGLACSWVHPDNEFPAPFPLNLSKESLTIEVTLRSIANVLASGGSGGSLTNAKLVYYEYIVPDAERLRISKDLNNIKFYLPDWQTLSKSTVATATLTTIDLSGIQGSIRSLGLPLVSVANQDTNHNYILNSPIDSMELKIDGTSIYVTEYVNESIIEETIAIKRRTGSNSTNGKCQEISFCRIHDFEQYSGSLNSQAFNKLELDVTHSVGANSYFKPVAELQVLMQFKDGLFIRYR